MLTLTFLGVGSAFAKRNFQSNALVEAWRKSPQDQETPDENLLIDFGATGPLAMHRLKEVPGFSYLARGSVTDYSAIRGVLVTHLHGDHVGGLEELALMSLSQSKGQFKPVLLGTEEVLTALWDRSLRGGLGIVDGGKRQLEDYFDVRSIHPKGSATPTPWRMLERYELSIFRTHHIQLHQRYDWPSFGVAFRSRTSGRLALFTGDTRFDPQGLGNLLAEAGIIFHDVQLSDSPAQVHPSIHDLRTLASSVKEKMFLYHYDDTWDDDAYEFVSREFAGFAQPQHRYVLFDER